MKKPTFEANPDVDRCIDYLIRHDRISYDELNRYLGRQINGRDRYILQTARRRLERTRGIIFVVEHGEGLVRANNRQVANLATDEPIRKIRRITRVAKKREPLVNVQDLSEEERVALYVGRLVIDMVDRNTTRSARSNIRKQLKKHGDEPLTLSQVTALRRFRKD